MSKEMIECKEAIKKLNKEEKHLKQRLKEIEKTKRDIILILVKENEKNNGI